jgi:diguanylate cyclase (GGDEF)-like protein
MSSVSNRLVLERERVAALQQRGLRMQHLISFGRRLSSEVDIDSLTRTLVSETRRTIGGDVVAFVRRVDAAVQPSTVDGDVAVTTVPVGEGVVGRCVDSGAPARTLVPADPFLPDVPLLPHDTTPWSLLVAPLVVDGRVTGALVVASRSEALFDETDEMALQVLVLLAAGALAAAERLDTTRALTLRDPLTGLNNRRKLDQDLEAVASAEGAAFLMIDIDHFKAFNDRHGHRRGDDLLRIVAGAITAAVRDRDVVYRYGGEEFSVLLVGTDVVEAGIVAERVRASVRDATAQDGIGPVTVSVGVAAHSAPIAASTMVEHADAALYAAKEAGRDRVLVRRNRATAPAGEG